MKKVMYVKLGLDILMAVTFVLFFNKQVLGGLTFHEIAGLVIAVLFFTHVLLNWQWVKKVTVKLFDRKLPLKTKFGYFLNVMLLITMTFIMISGIFISRVVFPNINVGNEQWFKISHISISFLVLILVAAHIGLHWKWVINVFKNMIKFRTPKLSLGILARVVTVALLVFGGYQMYSTNFIMQLQGVANVFKLSSSQMPEGVFKGGEKPNFQDGDIERGERPNLPEGDIEGGEGQFEKTNLSESGFKGRKSHSDSSDALGVIVTYFGIMSVFIIIIYYIDKFIMRNTRKKKKTNFSEGDLTSV
ncbi:DUF4405 domain-containing protein [Peribacillus butanolivorans]|uniref:DUF4405 domain-containing protein n=1 Tax=Peribacillus butanolivorans TaxID=421767 RepID=UPI0030CA0685